MNGNSAITLAAHLLLLSCISFGGIPVVLPDILHIVVSNQWLTDREFANLFAVAQAVPGPNMILLMGLIGWKVGGLVGALACALAIFGPPCLIYYAAYRLWDRFRNQPWQTTARRGLAPLTIGLVIAGGVVMAGATDSNWQGVALTITAAGVTTATRANPLWSLAAGGVAGALGLV